MIDFNFLILFFHLKGELLTQIYTMLWLVLLMPKKKWSVFAPLLINTVRLEISLETKADCEIESIMSTVSSIR